MVLPRSPRCCRLCFGLASATVLWIAFAPRFSTIGTRKAGEGFRTAAANAYVFVATNGGTDFAASQPVGRSPYLYPFSWLASRMVGAKKIKKIKKTPPSSVDNPSFSSLPNSRLSPRHVIGKDLQVAFIYVGARSGVSFKPLPFSL